MNSSHYWPPTKTPIYLTLLRFSRLTTPESNKADRKTILTAINSLPTSNLPIRPLIPLIYRNALKTELFERAIPEAQSFLKQNALILVGQELANQQWLQASVKTFTKHSIPIILLKGAAFANNLYPADAPRPGVDLDFLVRESDFSISCELLQETMDSVMMADNRLATHDTLFERMYVPRGRSTPVVEIHRGLTNPHIFDIKEDALWSASREHPAYGNKHIRVLSSEHTLLHLAVHAFRDMDFCNHNLLDAHELIAQQGISERVLLKCASEWGARAALYYLLHNASSVLGTQIEEKILPELKPSSPLQWIQRNLLQSNTLQISEKTIAYRIAQLASQLVFPDSFTAAIKFQANYASTRLKDLASR